MELNCRPKNIAIGVFYGPQENNGAENNEAIFNTLDTQITQKLINNEVIIGGDYNAKLEINNDNGKQEISPNGKLLQNII